MRRPDSGSVLIMTLLVCSIVFMLVVSYSTMVTIESKTIQMHDDVNLALYVADAGINRGFVELVNYTPLVSMQEPAYYTDTCFSSDNGTEGSYRVSTYTTLLGTDYPANAAVPVLQNDPGPVPADGRGKFRYAFLLRSTGDITRDGNLIARRTVMARVYLERALYDGEYEGYGRIHHWYEQNR